KSGATAVTRALELQIVAQHVEERRFRISRDLVQNSVYLQHNRHIYPPPATLATPTLGFKSRKNRTLNAARNSRSKRGRIVSFFVFFRSILNSSSRYGGRRP